MKPILLLPVLVLTTILAFTSCTAQQQNNDVPVENRPPEPTVTAPADRTVPDEPETPSVTYLSEPEVLVHEEIKKQTFDEGEIPENEYYKQTDSEIDGRVYEVIRADDGEKVALPRTETVLYESDSDDYYYEEVKYTYKIGEETVEKTQFSLHVPAADAGNESSDADTDAGTDANTGQDENKVDGEEAAPGPDNTIAASAAAPTEKAGD